MGLGSATVLTLSQAKDALIEQQNLLAQGLDPIDARNANNRHAVNSLVTFEAVAKEYIDAQKSGWDSSHHLRQWQNSLATYVYPAIGSLHPSQVTTEHILDILTPIWNTKRETASRVRNRIELVLNAAKARKLREGENPATWRGHLELLLTKKKRRDSKHHAALPWERMPDFWQKLIAHSDTSGKALQLTIMTALRTSEVLESQWSEINLDTSVWTIPAHRMKAGREHRVPLTSDMIKVIKTLPRGSSQLLFPQPKKDKPVPNAFMRKKLIDMRHDKTATESDWLVDGETITVHGFRSTFRDWAAENTNFANLVVEQALAHTISSSVEAAYRRGDLLDKRRELMEAWCAYLGTGSQKT
jgi:integrase